MCASVVCARYVLLGFQATVRLPALNGYIMTSLSSLPDLGFSGYTLNVEERAGLEVSLNKRRLEDGLQELVFWGKLNGDEDDYLIAVGFGPAQEDRVFYYT